jgi:ABC-type nitrate/sulfonate/bicarbonate transport system substrate-binding protein
MKRITFLRGLAALPLAGAASTFAAETIRVAIGTQDTTINCATGGLLIRELGLLEKYLPRDGKYKDVQYDIVWKNFSSGAPLTNEMLADKLDIGSMADFPGSANIAAFQKAGKKSVVGGAQGPNDQRALRLHRARHAAARRQVAGVGSGEGRDHHRPAARGGRPGTAGPQDRGAR